MDNNIELEAGAEADEHGLSPVYLSAEALLELEELTAGVRTDAPTLSTLLTALRTPQPSPTFEGNHSMSMLADARSYSMLRDALGMAKVKRTVNSEDFQEAIRTFFNQLEDGVRRGDRQRISDAKSFCIALGESLIGKQMRETYRNRENSDSRYVDENALS